MDKFKILISQPKPATARTPYQDMESRFNVEFDFLPLVQIEGLSAKEFRQQHINIADYTAILVNSRLAIDHFFRMCEQVRFQVPETMHYYCINEQVGNYLTKYIQYRKRKIFFGPNSKFEELLPTMNRRPNEKYMMVMSEASNSDTINMLASHNIEVKPAVMYRSVPAEWPKDKEFDYQMMVFFSPIGVQAIQQNFPDWKQNDTVVACFGQNTIQAAESAGWTVQIKAPTPEFPSINAAINHYLEQIPKIG